MPAGDLKLAPHRCEGFDAFVTYADDSDWVALAETALAMPKHRDPF